MSAPALAANASLRGAAMPAGFGRLSLSFDEPTTTRIRVGNGVLVVAFDSAVKVDISKIVKELPDYLSIVRTDPDGRGVRFALARPFKANLIEAGDKAFIDLLPESWTGLLPGPPPEVIAEMTERLRVAEAQAREAARKPPAPPKPLTLRSARLPTLERLIFQAPPETRLTQELADGTLRLNFDQQLAIEPSAIKPWLPEGVTLKAQETGTASTTIDLALPKDWQARSFRDDDGLIVDLLRPAKPGIVTLASLQTGANDASPKPPASAAPDAVKPAPEPTRAQPAEQAQPLAKPAVAAPVPDPTPQLVKIEASSGPQGSKIDFRFPRLTGAAAFSDAGTVTLVFDTRDTIDPASFRQVLPQLVEDTTVTREGKVTLVKLLLKSQQVARLVDDGPTWSLSLGEQAGKPAESLAPRRTIDERGQTVLAVPLPGMTGVHWLESGPAGLPLAVATVLGPTRAISKPYRFVEFGLLQTAHGIAVSPRADDVVVRANTDQVQIGRAGGLTVTLDLPEQGGVAVEKAPEAGKPLLDPDSWGKQRVANIRERARELLSEVASAGRGRKSEARLALARFYAANKLLSEAAGPLQALLNDDPAMRANREALFLKGVLAVQMHRDQDAVAAFNAGPIKEDAEAGLWRALAEQRLGRAGQALAGFRRGQAILDTYPDDLQAEFRPALARAAMAMQDMTVAEHQLDLLAELPKDVVHQEKLALLRTMLDDVSGRPETALDAYKALFEAKSRPVAAEAQLRGVKLALAQTPPAISADEAAARLETVSVTWRGGEIEIEALAELGRLYLGQKRWREAFQIARRANDSYPDNPLTRSLHDETAQRFAEMFSGRDHEQLPRIDALALFYDFKEFLPIGRRGDEITRLLADRLVELDLLDQAADILRYQMDTRLTGAARSTVAARLAMIALMNRKPAEALQALNATRLIELPADVKRARLLLEAKALSDLSRTDQALEMLEAERGPEVDRLRADVYWAGRRWREAGEAHERLLGESWRGNTTLKDGERADVMRSAISYVMASEALQLDRLRAKFAGKMAESSDARTFAFATSANRNNPADIREMARAAAGADTLSDFMKAYRERYPAYASAMRGKPQAEPAPPPPAGAAGAEAGTSGAQGRG
ncbi:hypothetical protein DWF00_09960 [Bosea caraganae]|uniref:Tetratricopeptide repeat protein n=1 Tax=Bosea caraganae TaxID=2763117 RepID=A0A370LBF2_9HYPH|nr:hypothetical protein DWF00_09960 [Bosea caraganae]RDJ29302.1 hypothetical protein DWE98_01730 [Bosea caraganae]